MRFQIADSLGMLESKGLPVPDVYREFVYDFAKPEFTSHPFVDMIVQEMRVDDFLIASHVLIVKEPVLLAPHTDESACTLYCMLKGAVECALTGFPKPVWFIQGQYFLFCINKGAHRAFFEPGVYQSFHINFPASFLGEIAPVEDPILQITRQPDQSAALTGSMWYPLYESIDELRNNTASSPVNDQRLVNIMEQMLLLVIDRKRGSGRSESRSIIDESVLHSVQHYINFHLNEQLNLQTLSRRFDLQPLELQEMFVRRSQAPVEDFIFNHRMELSRQLLQHTRMCIPQIVQETGFGRRTLFTKAYKQFFHMFPTEARRPSNRVRSR